MLFVLILSLIISFYLLAVVCEDFFIKSLDLISQKLKLPSDVAGATLMAIGSSAPEFFTALFAVMQREVVDVGTGTIVGSAIFNILVIIGASALFKSVKLTWQPVFRDILFYLFTIILLWVVFWDEQIEIGEAVVFLLAYAFYIWLVIYWKKFFPYKDFNSLQVFEGGLKRNKVAVLSRQLLGLIIPDPERKRNQYIFTFIISILFLAGLSYILVESAVNIAYLLNISPTIIALTILAGGTSIPDLLSSVIVAKQGRGDMAVSNAIGSNIFDILVCLGLPWFIVLLVSGQNIKVGVENLFGSVFLLFATIVTILLLLLIHRWTIGRKSGLILIGFYLFYLFYNLWQIPISFYFPHF